jgi:hypothetical protein
MPTKPQRDQPPPPRTHKNRLWMIISIHTIDGKLRRYNVAIPKKVAAIRTMRPKTCPLYDAWQPPKCAARPPSRVLMRRIRSFFLRTNPRTNPATTNEHGRNPETTKEPAKEPGIDERTQVRLVAHSPLTDIFFNRLSLEGALRQPSTPCFSPNPSPWVRGRNPNAA